MESKTNIRVVSVVISEKAVDSWEKNGQATVSSGGLCTSKLSVVHPVTGSPQWCLIDISLINDNLINVSKAIQLGIKLLFVVLRG